MVSDNGIPEFVAPYETEVAALALVDKCYKIIILVDVLDANWAMQSSNVVQ